MERTNLIIIALYLVFTGTYIETVGSPYFEDLYELSDLTEFCPYSSFCGWNASSVFPFPDIYTPCCQSCSCDSECGLRGDCCFGHLDNYKEEKDKMICENTLAVQSITDEERFGRIAFANYRMINKCDVTQRLSETNDSSCEHNSSDIEESFHPMYSPFTGHIYINDYCAMCNNISDAVQLERAIICPQNAETTLSDFMEHFVSGKVSTNYPGCLPFYIPPSDVDLSSESCYRNVIRECNISGKMKEKNKYWDRCEMLNATFVPQRSRVAYANVFCYLCNLRTIKESFEVMKCKNFVPVEDKNDFDAPLTIILKISEGTQQNQDSRKEVETEDHCPLNSVAVNSFTKTCRKRKCPMGQFLINNQCDYHARQWIGGPFAVMLRLSTLKGNPSLRTSFFEDMTAAEKYDNLASWIKRKSLRRWTFRVMYHPSEDQEKVDYIVVKATYPTKRVDPNFLRKSVLTALEDKWKIVGLNTSISFSISLNEYTEYISLTKQYLLKKGINISNNIGYIPSRKTCHGLNIQDDDYSLLLLPIFLEAKIYREDGMFITKLFFCNQVELLPDEYELSKCMSIFFKVKNVELHTYSTVYLFSNNLPVNDSIALSQNHLPRIYVCLHEFDRAASVGVGVSFCIYGLLAMICMAKVTSN